METREAVQQVVWGQEHVTWNGGPYLEDCEAGIGVFDGWDTAVGIE